MALPSLGEVFNSIAGLGMPVVGAPSRAHMQCSTLLWTCFRRDPEAFDTDFRPILDFLLCCPDAQEAAMRSAALFLARAPAPDCETYAEGVIDYLRERTRSGGAQQRLRCCKLLRYLLDEWDEEYQVDSGLAEALCGALMGRLADVNKGVRAQAALALQRLRDPGEGGEFDRDAVTGRLLEVLRCENTAEVRSAVLASLGDFMTHNTLPAVFERTLDEAVLVRSVAFKLLGSRRALKLLGAEQRAALVRRGTRDCSPKVRQTAAQMLQCWLAEVDGNLLHFLWLFDVQNFEQEAEDALRTVMDLDANIVSTVDSLLASGEGLGDGQAGVIDLVRSMFWRVVCLRLKTTAERLAAAAANAVGAQATTQATLSESIRDCMDTVIPSTTQRLVEMIGNHTGPMVELRFSARQLLCILASCSDLADAADRAAVVELLPHLWQLPPVGEASEHKKWVQAVMDVAGCVHTTHTALVEATLEVLEPWAKALETGNKDAGLDAALRVHFLDVLAALLARVPRSRGAASAGCTSLRLSDCLAILNLLMHDGSSLVRVRVVLCIGLYLLIDFTEPVRDAVPWLIDQVRSGDVGIQIAACRALCDLALAYGAKLLGSAEGLVEMLVQHVPSSGEWHSRAGRVRNTPEMSASQHELIRVLAEGLAKLVLANHKHPLQQMDAGDRRRCLEVLAGLQFDPVNQDSVSLHRMLHIFFDTYVGISDDSKKELEDVMASLQDAPRRRAPTRPETISEGDEDDSDF
eukprot:evm.model.scf_1812.3 EVM.evm.TU.scf_1812.3   scf_1812:21805-25799(+)